jgi:hypothetical protein
MRRGEIEALMMHVGQVPPKIFAQPHVRRNSAKFSSILPKTVNVDLKVAPLSAVSFGKSEVALACDMQLVTFQYDVSAEVSVTKDVSASAAAEVAALVHLSSATVFGLLATGKLIGWENGNLNQIHIELARVSHVAASGRYYAVVSEDSTLGLFGPRLQFSIPFYGDAICCCTLSKPFGIAVCGTVFGTLVICSLFEGTKLAAIKLGQEFRPLKVMITQSWGFLVTYACKNSGGNLSHHLFVHSVNGRFIRSVEIGFGITAWCTWASRKSFDFMVVACEGGRMFGCEVFYLNIGEPFNRCTEQVMAVKYMREQAVVVAVLKDGRMLFAPLLLEE